MAHHHCQCPTLDQSLPLRLIIHWTGNTNSQQTGVIDDAYRSVSQCDNTEKRDEGKRIVEELARLKYEVEHDRPLVYVPTRQYRDLLPELTCYLLPDQSEMMAIPM